ncbi:hypothetical protein ACKI16_29265 [Streptomyces scabiei]|uniref:hypothetical protein n=1 Tax=Streptomyces scabiei TaxID=1930 RepID=UPI0038F60839
MTGPSRAGLLPDDECEDDYGTAECEAPPFASEWLLSAADDTAEAQQQWLKDGVAVLTCGRQFAAVRIHADVVWGAARTRDLARVDEFLDRALCGGPVFMDPKTLHYYALVSPSSAAEHEWSPKRLLTPLRSDARLLSTGAYIGVPIPERRFPHRRLPYWCVPVGESRTLCSPHAVLQLLARGRFAVAEQGVQSCP